jgi:hypothetical protein
VTTTFAMVPMPGETGDETPTFFHDVPARVVVSPAGTWWH